MKRYVLAKADGEFPVLRSVQAIDPQNVVRELDEGDEVDLLGQPQGQGEETDTARFVEVAFSTVPGAPVFQGWLETQFLADEVDAGEPPPIARRDFVRSCVRTELKFNATENAAAEETADEPYPILADYLIALAIIEARFDDDAMTDFGPKLEGSDAIGPYQISSQEWQEYLNSLDSQTPLTSFQRKLPLLQIDGAAYLTRRDMKEFSTLATPSTADDADGPFVPSHLTVFHARLLGVKAAHDFHKLKTGGQADTDVDTALKQQYPDDTQRALLIENRKRFLKHNQQVETVDGFYNKTASILNDAFKRALTFLKEDFPKFLVSKDTLGSSVPWLEIALKEHKEWQNGNFDEDVPPGLDKVKLYFQSTDHPPVTSAVAWCGAFVSHCLKTAGDEFADSIIKSSARAANWKKWGDVELRSRDRFNIPPGAIVVVAPTEPGTSGHVGFATRVIQHEDKLEIVSGNQSDKITLFPYRFNRIVSVRWKDFGNKAFGDPASDATDNSPIGNAAVPATERDLLIMARTVYGEARSESRRGREAVASVILNRVRSGRYPNTVEKVCLQRKQFSCWNANDPNRPKIIRMIPGTGDGNFDSCFDISKKAIQGAVGDPTNGATHYHGNYISKPSWAANGQVTLREGKHIFYTNIA